MEISSNTIENLLESHQKGRDHLLRLLGNITEEMWLMTPENSRWSIQRAANHIVNAELLWMYRSGGSAGPEPNYLKRDITLEEFRIRQKESFDECRRLVLAEKSEKGFYYKNANDGEPSYLWSIIRVVQHAIYHTGMISLLRQQVSAPPLENDQNTWGPMVDSVFASII